MAQIAIPRLKTEQVGWRTLATQPSALLIGVLCFAVLVRFIGLAHQSVWLDESFSVFLSRRSPADILSFAAANDSHPPLYYLMLHYWMRGFGESEVAIRGLSAVFGALSVYVAYKLGQALFGERTGITTALLVAVSPLLIWYSQEARMYALLFCLTVLAGYFLVRAMQSPRSWGWWLGYALAMTGALYTDNGGLWFFLATNLYFLATGWRDKQIRLPWLTAQVVVAVLYLPWLPSFITQTQNVTQSFWLSAPAFSDILATLIAFNSFNVPLEALSFVYLTAVLLWVHIIPGRHVPRRGLLASWLFVPILVSYLLSLRQPIFLLRNLIVASVGYYLLVARAIWSFENRKFAMAIIAPLLVMNAMSLVHNYRTEKKEQWREAAAYVGANAGQGQMLLFDANYMEMPFRYYDKTGLPGRGYPFNETLVHNDSTELGDLAVATKDYSTVWLVLSHDTDVDAGGTVKAWLDGHASLKDQRSFKDIEVLRYEKGGGSSAPQSPTRR